MRPAGSRRARGVPRSPAAGTYLLITHLTSWDLDTYQDWLATTWARLARVADGNS
jgi:hypothetical protein